MRLPQSPVDIGCLPDDVLCTIFRVIVPHHRMGPITLPIPLRQITLSHVSQHWRAVVLGNPLLWNTILYTRGKHNLELCQLFLERSQKVALDIQAIVSWTRLEPEESETFTPLFLPHIRRWRKMDLVCESPQLVSHWSIAPLLESLELRIEARINTEEEAINIPFLQGGAPRLKYLYYSSQHGDGRPLDCPSLQELLLEGPYSFSDAPPGDSFHSFTSLVAPQLTHLVARKFAIESPFRPPAPVQFDSLVQLELQVQPLTLWEFMEHCRLPKLNSVTITLRLATEPFVFGGVLPLCLQCAMS